jgi:hypothetical protein
MSVQLVQHGKQLEMDYNAHIAQSPEVYPNIQSHLQQFVQLSKSQHSFETAYITCGHTWSQHVPIKHGQGTVYEYGP